MARKSDKQIKKDKEVSWFIRKYLWQTQDDALKKEGEK